MKFGIICYNLELKNLFWFIYIWKWTFIYYELMIWNIHKWSNYSKVNIHMDIPSIYKNIA